MDIATLFYKKTFNIFIAIEDNCKVKNIYSKADTTLYYIFVVLKEFIRLGLITKKKHRYFLTKKGLFIRDNLLNIKNLIKK